MAATLNVFLFNVEYQLIKLKPLQLGPAISYLIDRAETPTKGSLYNPQLRLQMSFVVRRKLRCPEV